MLRRLSLLLLAVLASIPVAAGPLDELTRPIAGRRMRASSTDVTGRNRDHAVLEPGQTVTLAELFGPGEIRHIWFTVSTKGTATRRPPSCASPGTTLRNQRGTPSATSSPPATA
ncbi:hypothetical protein HS125_14530 [bacterium]|nr:hypothetical protein [bacterium]